MEYSKSLLHYVCVEESVVMCPGREEWSVRLKVEFMSFSVLYFDCIPLQVGQYREKLDMES